MQVLILGSGGREHALGWKLSQSSQLKKLYFSPGNPGTAQLGENVALADQTAIIEFAKSAQIDLVVVGPEQPLVEGISDVLQLEGILCYGPSKAAAQLEGSKAFAKEIMEAAGVKTAAHQTFSDFTSAWQYVQTQPHPLVVKADGLAAGKGVTICQTLTQSKMALSEALEDAKFGHAGQQVVVEAFLEGREASFHLICDGERVLPLIAAQDHKALRNGNQGPNTGGMGTFAPTPFVTDAMTEALIDQVCLPVLKEMNKRGTPFRGTLFTGLMLTDEGPYVLEFNCRFGDPETQVMMALMEDDLLPVLYGAAKGSLPTGRLAFKQAAAVCVIMAAEGYPASARKGDAIAGIEQASSQGVTVFQAGTKQITDQLVTNGGRVLGVTATGSNLSQARQLAYQGINTIQFNGVQYRTDIGELADT